MDLVFVLLIVGLWLVTAGLVRGLARLGQAAKREAP
jgi:hypothetical protein